MTKEDIQAMNAEFNALPKPEQRKRIAKEVLLMLEHGSMVADNGYGIITGGKRACYTVPDLQVAISDGYVCVGCAKAAIIAAKASVGDGIHMKDDFGYGSISRAYAGRELGDDRLADIIETLYEGDVAFLGYKGETWRHQLNPVQWTAIRDFKNRLHELHSGRTQETMKAIMQVIFQNIVDNDGYLVIDGHKFGTDE